MSSNSKSALKLRAETEDDLVVISSALQDAILKVGEIVYNNRGRFMTLRLSRFKHEARFKHEQDQKAERVQTGLRIDSILNIKSRNLDRTDPDAYAVLLSMRFEPSKEKGDPSGLVHLVLAGGGELAVKVECIDVILADTKEVRETDKLPIHYDGS